LLEYVGRQSRDLSSSAPNGVRRHLPCPAKQLIDHYGIQETVKRQISAIRREIRSQDAKQRKQMEKLKNRMQDGFKEKVTAFMQ
jgi:hypothetical protein